MPEIKKKLKKTAETVKDKVSEIKKKTGAGEHTVGNAGETYAQTLFFRDEAENISREEKQGQEDMGYGAAGKGSENTGGNKTSAEREREDKADCPHKPSSDNIEDILEETLRLETKKYAGACGKETPDIGKETPDIGKEILDICRAEIGREKDSKKNYFTIRACAEIFFVFLLLYTTVMTFNNMRYLNTLNAGINDLQSVVMNESNAVNKKINDINMFINRTIRSGYMGNAGAQPGAFDDNAMSAVPGARTLPAIGATEIAPGGQETMPQDQRGRQPAAAEEPQVSHANRTLAGITYEMYANTSPEDRLSILATHFRTNTVLMEYMLRTMAERSIPANVDKTEGQIRQNLKAILDTAAGQKMLAAYSLWQKTADDPRILADIDAKLIKNKFYGLPFIPAVENALLDR